MRSGVMAISCALCLAWATAAQAQTATPTATATPTPTVTATPRADRGLVLVLDIIQNTDANPARFVYLPSSVETVSLPLHSDLSTFVSTQIGDRASLFIEMAGAEAGWFFTVECQPEPDGDYWPIIGSPCSGVLTGDSCVWPVLPRCNNIRVVMNQPPVSGAYVFAIGVIIPVPPPPS